MAIPISYNIRNLAVRKTTTLMTAAGIAMTVAVLLAVLGLVSGLGNRRRGRFLVRLPHHRQTDRPDLPGNSPAYACALGLHV